MKRVGVLLVVGFVVGFVVVGLAVAGAVAPAAADDTAKVLVAIDARTGRQRWDMSGKAGPGNLEPLGAANGIVIASDNVCGGRLLPDGRSEVVAGFDAATGERRWRRVGVAAPMHSQSSDSRFFSGPLPVFVDDRVGALDPRSGDTLWSARKSGELTSYNHESLFLTRQHRVVAVDRATGLERWRFEIPTEVIYEIGVDDGHVAVLLWPVSDAEVPTDRVVVLDARTGAEQQQLAIAPRYAGEHVLVMGATLVVSGWAKPNGGALTTGYDVGTGLEIWQRREQLAWFASVSDAPRIFTYGSEDVGRANAVAVHTGRTQWSMEIGDFGASLHPVGSMVVRIDDDGALHGLRAATGAEVWSGDSPDDVKNDPVTGDGVLYLGGGCEDHGIS